MPPAPGRVGPPWELPFPPLCAAAIGIGGKKVDARTAPRSRLRREPPGPTRQTGNTSRCALPTDPGPAGRGLGAARPGRGALDPPAGTPIGGTACRKRQGRRALPVCCARASLREYIHGATAAGQSTAGKGVSAQRSETGRQVETPSTGYRTGRGAMLRTSRSAAPRAPLRASADTVGHLHEQRVRA